MWIMDNYWIYKELVEKGTIEIKATQITKENWKLHFDSIFNIMLDGIETEELRAMKIIFIYDTVPDNDKVVLTIYDYLLNVLFYYYQVSVYKPILPCHFFYKKYLTKKDIQKYTDKYFIPQNRKSIDIIEMNNIIDVVMYNFHRIDAFSMFLANTINMSDFIDLMERNKEVYDIIHSDFTNVAIEDIKSAGLKGMDRLADIIKKDTQHCLSYFIRAGEGLNKKQAKEVFVNIGTKPSGDGGVFPYQVNTNYFMGGSNDLISYFIDASTSRFAQIIINKNVGDSGHFSRLLGLNNLNSKLHPDKDYVCDCHPSNLQKLYVENLQMVNSMSGQYYRFDPHGQEFCIEKDDMSLVGKTIYKRSPMTCASAARGEGICYRCYGDLAYSVNNINIGKIAAEELSSDITQRMLSAKHLIDTAMAKITWNDEFKDLFEIDYNIIKIREDIDFNNYYLRIDMNELESEYEEEDEDDATNGLYMNDYVNEFGIVEPDGNIIKMSTSNYDNIYITPDLNGILKSRKAKDRTEDDVILYPLNELYDLGLFAMKLTNGDLTKAYDKVTTILDKTQEIDKHDKNSILQQFIMTLQDCNLNVHSSHIEVLLMNQIRRGDDILETPEWQYQNQKNYKIITLKKALSNNPSITVSLMYQEIKRMLINPITYQKKAPSITDLFFMTQPQEYLSSKYVEGKENIIHPLIYK